MDEGGCDRYLFATQKRAEHSLLDLLSFASDDDIFMNQSVLSLFWEVFHGKNQTKMRRRQSILMVYTIWDQLLVRLRKHIRLSILV